jgi:hypothetical protein
VLAFGQIVGLKQLNSPNTQLTKEEWAWVDPYFVWQADLALPFNDDVVFDMNNNGYWIRKPSKTAVIWALKGVQFGTRFGEQYYDSEP